MDLQLSSISMGGVSLALKILNSVTRTSSEPVFMFGLTMLPVRATSLPRIASTYSERIFEARAKSSAGSVLESNTTCISPVRSRSCTKISAPRSRRTFVQPISVTSLPRSASVSSVQ